MAIPRVARLPCRRWRFFSLRAMQVPAYLRGCVDGMRGLSRMDRRNLDADSLQACARDPVRTGAAVWKNSATYPRENDFVGLAVILYFLFLFLVPFQEHPILGAQLFHVGSFPITPIKLVGIPLVAAALLLPAAARRGAAAKRGNSFAVRRVYAVPACRDHACLREFSVRRRVDPVFVCDPDVRDEFSGQYSGQTANDDSRDRAGRNVCRAPGCTSSTTSIIGRGRLALRRIPTTRRFHWS